MNRYIIAPWVTDYINIEKQSIRPQVKKYLSQNPHDGAVDMLMSHPELIDEIHLCSNPNPRLTNKILDIITENKEDEKYWEQLLLNSNDKIVDYILSRIKEDKSKIHKSLFENPNQRIVDYLLSIFDLDHEIKNDDSLAYFIARNSNDRIVDYIFSRPQLIANKVLRDFNLTKNSNNRVVEDIIFEKISTQRYVIENKNPLLLKIIKNNTAQDKNLAVLSNPLIFEINRKDSCIRYKPINWINIKIKCLSRNPSDKALDILERNTDDIDDEISSNTNERAMKLAMEYSSKLSLPSILKNPSNAAVNYILKKMKRLTRKDKLYILANSNNRLVPVIIERINKIIERGDISEKTKAIISMNRNDKIIDYVLNNHPELIDIISLASNPSNKAADYVLKNLNKLDKEGDRELSQNTNDKIVNFLIKNPSFIDWEIFAGNSNDRAVEYFLTNVENHIDEIKRWIFLVQNTNPKILPFIQSIHQNLTKKDICALAGNPIIFQLDYQEIKKCQNDLKRELISTSMNPRRVERAINLERERIRSNSDDPNQDLDEIDVDLDRIL